MKKRTLLTFLLGLFMMLDATAQDDVKVKNFEEATASLKSRTEARYDQNDVAAALIKVRYPKPGARFEAKMGLVGDAEYREGEYWVYLPTGTKDLTIFLPEIPPMTVVFADFGIRSVLSKVTYNMEFEFPSKGAKLSFYADAGFAMGGMMDAGLAFGMYLGGFNIEVDAMLPFGPSDVIWWNHPDKAPVRCTYKPSLAIGGRLGYGIKLGEKMRLTPQVGVQFLKTSEATSDGAAHYNGSYNSSLTIAAKFQYFLGKSFYLGLCPEFDLAIVKSPGFKTLAATSSKINKWNNGIGARVFLGIEF